MRMFYSFYLLSWLTGNPMMAGLILVLLYIILDRGFIGLLPDITRPWRRSSRIRQLRATVALNPADAGAWLELGALLLDARRVHEALDVLEKVAQKLDDHATAQYTLGAARVQAGHYAEGVSALRRAIALRPEVQYGMPYVYLAKAILRAGKALEGGLDIASRDELALWIQTVIRYGNVETCYRMGVTLQEGGLTPEAVRLFNEALASYRQSPVFARRVGRRWALLACMRLARLGQRTRSSDI